MLTGTIVNGVAIIVGGILGLLLKKGLPEKFNKTLMQALALAVLLIGLKGALAVKGDDLMLVIFSLVIGSCIGEGIDIEKRLEQLGQGIQNRFSKLGAGFTKGFVTTSLIYCVGAMAIMGALEGGLKGKHDILFAKAILDGVSAVVFAATMGFGVVASAVPVVLYQGAIALGAGVLKDFLVPGVIDQMSVVGGLLIAAIGINILELTRIRVGNMLPAVFLPLIWFMVQNLF